MYSVPLMLGRLIEFSSCKLSIKDPFRVPFRYDNAFSVRLGNSPEDDALRGMRLRCSGGKTEEAPVSDVSTASENSSNF